MDNSAPPPAVAAWIKTVLADYKTALNHPQIDTMELELQQLFDQGVLAQNDKMALTLLLEKKSEEMKPQPTDKKEPLEDIASKSETQNIIIFDWDDTLFCTSYLQKLQRTKSLQDPAKTKLFPDMDEAVSRILKMALSIEKRNIFIVTNSAKGWVQYTSKLYLPGANAIICAENIGIISARALYSEDHPNEFGLWKKLAFLSLVEAQNLKKQVPSNIVNIGDNNMEIQAGRALKSYFTQAVLKSVKLQNKPPPGPGTIVSQLTLLVNQLKSIFDLNKNVTMQSEPKRAPKDPEEKVQEKREQSLATNSRSL